MRFYLPVIKVYISRLSDINQYCMEKGRCHKTNFIKIFPLTKISRVPVTNN